MNNNNLQNSYYPLFITDKFEYEKSLKPFNFFIINKNKIKNRKKNSISY